MSFANLKTNRANDIASLVSAAESVGGGGEKKSYRLKNLTTQFNNFIQIRLL